MLNRWLMTVCIAVLSGSVFAEDSRRAFSYLGTGFDFINYGESTTVTDQNLSVESEASGQKFSRRAGGYVAYTDDWGFYVNTGSTWGTREISETWTIEGTPVQYDNFSLRRSEVLALVARKVTGKHYALFGLSGMESSFTRYGWSYPDQTTYNITQKSEDTNLGEDVSQIFIYMGYEFNDFYVDTSRGLKFQLQAFLGLPAYSETVNTADADTKFTASFDGYLVRLIPSLGWQIDDHFMLAASLDMSVNYRNEDTIQDGSSLKILPENELSIVSPAISAYWSF